MAFCNGIIDEEKPVVILVPGLVGWGLTDDYWDTALSVKTNTFGLTIAASSPSAASSQHDRACQLFAQIRGEKVDYGAEHSDEFQHSQFGKDYTNRGPLSSQWSAKHPIHLVCHSSGANAGRYLQYLLKIDYWGCGTSADWIASISVITGNLCGSIVPVMFGAETDCDLADKSNMLGMMEQLLNAVRWVSKKRQFIPEKNEAVLNWQLEQWGYNSTLPLAGKDWMDQINTSKLFTNRDHAFYDLSIRGCERINELIPEDCPSTFYFSYYAQITDRSLGDRSISSAICPVLIMPTAYILNLGLSDVPLPKYMQSDEWFDNDGALPVASQRFPRGRENTAQQDPELTTNSKIHHGSDSMTSSNIIPGIWYYSNIQTLINASYPWDHLDPIWGRTFVRPKNITKSVQEQTTFYEFIYRRIANLPSIVNNK